MQRWALTLAENSSLELGETGTGATVQNTAQHESHKKAYLDSGYVGGLRRNAFDTNGDGTLEAVEFHNMVTALRRKHADCESRIANGRSLVTRQIPDLVVEDAEDVEEVADSLHGQLEEELATTTQDYMDEDDGNELRHAVAPTNVPPTSKGGMP